MTAGISTQAANNVNILKVNNRTPVEIAIIEITMIAAPPIEGNIIVLIFH